MISRPSKALDTSRISTVLRPSRLAAAAISTFFASWGASWAFSASYRAMRSVLLVVRARAPRMIHSYSFFRRA